MSFHRWLCGLISFNIYQNKSLKVNWKRRSTVYGFCLMNSWNISRGSSLIVVFGMLIACSTLFFLPNSFVLHQQALFSFMLLWSAGRTRESFKPSQGWFVEQFCVTTLSEGWTSSHLNVDECVAADLLGSSTVLQLELCSVSHFDIWSCIRPPNREAKCLKLDDEEEENKNVEYFNLCIFHVYSSVGVYFIHKQKKKANQRNGRGKSIFQVERYKL